MVTSWISHRTNENTDCGIVRRKVPCGWGKFFQVKNHRPILKVLYLKHLKTETMMMNSRKLCLVISTRGSSDDKDIGILYA